MTPFPLKNTSVLVEQERHLRKVEFLPIPSIIADFQLNLNTEVLLRSMVEMWRDVVGMLRLEGLHKTYRLIGQSKPADGHISIVGQDRLSDGETFSISDGSTTITFEFDVIGNGVDPGHTAIDVSAVSSVDDVRNAVINAINTSGLNITAQPTLSKPVALGGGGVGPGIDLFNTDTSFAGVIDREQQNTRIVDTVVDEGFTHRGMAGARLNTAVGAIFVVEPDEINDGEVVIIPPQAGNPQEVYEFDKNATVGAGNISVDISSASHAQIVADILASTINSNSIDIQAAIVPILASGFITALEAGKFQDGETFVLDDGTNPPTTFEFDKDASVEPGHVAIDIASAGNMQEVRAAMITAINNVGTLAITASNPGFGKRITLTNGKTLSSANVGDITHTITHQEFLTAPILGYRARVLLTNSTPGSIYNETLTHTVSHEDFAVEGMVNGSDGGWDITSGRCAFEGYNVALDDIPRLSAIVGEQSFLKVRVTERRLTYETDPDVIQVSMPGVSTVQQGANLYRWSAELVIEPYDQPAPILKDNEVLITDGVLCEFDAVNGQSIVANSEVPIRATKFGSFIEPQDVATKVSKSGDSMTGSLAISATGSDPGIEATGGPSDGVGGSFQGQGAAVGVEGLSEPNIGDAGVSGVGGFHGVKGQTQLDGGIGVLGMATSFFNGVGVMGIGSTGTGVSNAGPGVMATGGIGLHVDKTNPNYPHIRVIPSGDSSSLPSSSQQGDLTIPATGLGAGGLYLHDGTSWDTVRASTLGKVGNVEDIASADKDVLRYSAGNGRWERVPGRLGEVMYFPPTFAHVSASNANVGSPILNLSRGEIAIVATGTGSASLIVSWCVPLPPGFESWGADNLDVIVIPVKCSNTGALFNIEVYDSGQAIDISKPPTNFSSTGYEERFVKDVDLAGSYPNTNNNQGNMIVQAVASFSNGDTFEIGGLYIKSRVQNSFGSIPYNA
ncbi:MAG: hypothetical protein CL920_32735 [Deltaproteobacteria bacterium]|nr:hypothetical protein [Deltaproteobacteria bacterium]MBU53488.1 hypothetical protein [Deltaproteobacteria bacterium]|tara:strand:- start:10731 stop:13610 length:2880 start_codon:yes stop_codon:yes gene_type:complete